MTQFETLSLVVSFIGVIVSGIVLVLLLQQLRLLRRQVTDAREALEDSRRVAEKENARLAKHATFDFVASTTTKVLDLARSLPPNGSTPEEVQAFLDKAVDRTTPEFFVLRDYLNILENMLTGVNMGVFDEEVIENTSGSRIIRTWKVYSAWIMAERAKTGQATLWIQIETSARNLENARTRRASISPALS